MNAHIFILSIVLLLATSACSHISDDERLIYVPPVEVNRAVLIEDFTGQRCVNCPNATDEIARLQQQYGEDNVIAVGIHSGPFGHRSTMESALLPLATETGDAYYRHWGVTAQPGVLINRTGGVCYAISDYAKAVKEAIAKPTVLSLAVSEAMVADGRLTVTVVGESALTISGRLQVWLVEDNVTDTQYMPDGSINRDYLHQHVFRTSLTADLLGDPVSAGDSRPMSKTYTTALDAAWQPQNLAVVAFVYSDAEGVVQAVRRPVTEETE